MSHTTIGIDINHNCIRYAQCQVFGLNQPIEVTQLESIPIQATEDDDGLDAAFEELSQRLSQIKNVSIDAIGLSLDPTYALSATRILPFNDPHMVEQVLNQTMMDSWKIDEEAQLAFEIGEFVEDKKGAEGEESSGGGYKIHIINYPHQRLKNLLERLKRVRIEPNVALPSTNALSYAIQTIIAPQDGAWAIIDFGDKTSVFTVYVDNEIKLSRAMKIGSHLIDEALMEAFSISAEEARELKETSGFVSMPGKEAEQYNRYVSGRKIVPSQRDPMVLATTCRNALSVFITAIQQTIGNFALQNRIDPECIYIVGGGARLCGLADWLSEVLDVDCEIGLPTKTPMSRDNQDKLAMDIDSAAIAVAAAAALDNKCPLNLRRGDLSHKGSLSYILDNIWLLASCAVGVIIVLIFMTVTKANAIHQEHDKLKAALEETSMEVFGKKLMTYQQIEKEISSSEGFEFIPVRTAFSHISWISSNVNDNLADVEMDLNSLDIDNQRKIVTIRGEVAGDDGLPRFMQLLEQYECFPNEIQEPKTSKVKERTSFTLRIDSNHCATGGDSE